MDLVYKLHYLVLSQKGDLMSPGRNERAKNLRRHSSLPEKKDIRPTSSMKTSESNPYQKYNGNVSFKKVYRLDSFVSGLLTFASLIS
jgi:hypothetical protein